MNAPLSTDVAAIPQSTPITSVRDLRARHSTLLQRQRSSEATERVSPGEMLGFLEAAQALGKLLEERAQRENAQGVMDYWTASLLSVAPRAGEHTRPFTLAPFEPGAQTAAQSAEASARKRVETAMKAATAFYNEAPQETQKAVQRVLRRLVRLKTNSLEAYANPLAVTPNDPDKAVLDALVEKGVFITRTDSSTTASDATTYDLADPSILLEWTPAYQIVTERRGFREMVRGWDKNKRQDGGLLNRRGELESLAGYTGLDDMEDAFFKASSVGASKALYVLIGTLTILVVLMGGLIYNYRTSAKAQKKLTSTEITAREASEKAKTALEEKARLLEEAGQEQTRLLAEVTKADMAKGEALAKLTAANTAKDKALEDLTTANQAKDKALVELTEATRKKDDALKERDKALADLQQELKDTATVNEQKYAGVRRDLETVANLIAARADLPPEVAAIITQYRSKTSEPTQQVAGVGTTGQSLADALSHPHEKAEPQPGMRISVGEKDVGVSGTLGVFVKKKNSPETYLVAPRYLFTGAAGTNVYSGADAQKVIATLIDTPLTTHGLSDDVALAKVAEGVSVSNSLPGLGKIESVETQPKPGMKVRLVGSGSGIAEGEIVSLEKDGLIKTTRLSQAGDAGAPVVTAEGNRLVGLLYGRSPDDQSLVVPATLLDRYGLELATPAPAVATTPPLQGALGEIFVADGDPNNIPLAQRYVKALLDQGMIMPVPTAQPRRRVPPDESEVRCYDTKLFEDPDSIAHRTLKLLIAAGIPAGKIRVSYVEDADAPRNFLQISLARNALTGKSPKPPQGGARKGRQAGPLKVPQGGPPKAPPLDGAAQARQ